MEPCPNPNRQLTVGLPLLHAAHAMEDRTFHFGACGSAEILPFSGQDGIVAAKVDVPSSTVDHSPIQLNHHNQRTTNSQRFSKPFP